MIEVVDSYKFSDGRLIAFLKYEGGKLSPQTILQDESGRQWRIRQYFWTTGSAQHYQMIADEEAQNIFQYLLEGIDHNEKPEINSKVTLLGSS